MGLPIMKYRAADLPCKKRINVSGAKLIPTSAADNRTAVSKFAVHRMICGVIDCVKLFL